MTSFKLAKPLRLSLIHICTPMTARELSGVISMQSVNQTEVLQISAETVSPELSAEICNTLAEVAPSVLQRVVKAGSVEVIGSAKAPQNASSPNVCLLYTSLYN